MNIFDNKDECFILRSGVFLEYKMGFEKLEDLLPYSVHRIEEKMVMTGIRCRLVQNVLNNMIQLIN